MPCATRDPRTLDQRRCRRPWERSGTAPTASPCQCGSDDCDAAGVQPNAVVLNLIAEENSP